MDAPEIFAYVKELGDHIYIQSPVSVYEPDEAEIETFAFKDAVKGLADLKSLAPNPKILWAQGRYVEADKANGNADQWTAGELTIKSLTPVLMPITVMHDLRSAVGVIAHTALKLPKEDPAVPRARLENMLAIWAHRFPDVADETRINAKQSTLMQSMECISPYYDCTACGNMFQRHQNWQEEWREHSAGHGLSADGGELVSPARILRSVVFTGTGLIFGTRGAKGAYSEAHVEVEALAELHAKTHRDRGHRPPKPRRQNFMDIEDAKYQELVAAKTTAESQVTELTAKVTKLEADLQTAEADKVKVEEERDAASKKADAAEEKARVADLRDERLASLGAGFKTKLSKMSTTAKVVNDQAGKLSDEEWSARLTELEELLSVKRDAEAKAGDDADADDEGKDGKDGKGDDATAGLLFEREVVARDGGAAGRSGGTGGEGSGAAPSEAARRSVIGGLVRKQTRTTTKETAGAK